MGNDNSYASAFKPGEKVMQIFLGSGGAPVVILYTVVDAAPSTLVLMPRASNGQAEPKLITFTAAQGIPRTYRETEVDKMFIDYLRNIERLPEAVLNADFTQKDLNNQIASLKKISDLWSETKKAAAEATAR